MRLTVQKQSADSFTGRMKRAVCGGGGSALGIAWARCSVSTSGPAGISASRAEPRRCRRRTPSRSWVVRVSPRIAVHLAGSVSESRRSGRLMTPPRNRCGQTRPAAPGADLEQVGEGSFAIVELPLPAKRDTVSLTVSTRPGSAYQCFRIASYAGQRCREDTPLGGITPAYGFRLGSDAESSPVQRPDAPAVRDDA